MAHTAAMHDSLGSTAPESTPKKDPVAYLFRADQGSSLIHGFLTLLFSTEEVFKTVETEIRVQYARGQWYLVGNAIVFADSRHGVDLCAIIGTTPDNTSSLLKTFPKHFDTDELHVVHWHC